MFGITISKSHVRRFRQKLDEAYKRGDKRTIYHLAVLSMIACKVGYDTKVQPPTDF